MKIFVTGISGLLGVNLAWQLKDRFEVHGCFNRHVFTAKGIEAVQCDLTREGAIDALLESARPDVIINAAGQTSVDQCEADPDLARRLNIGVAVSAAGAASKLGAKLVHISTDHLFDGTAANRRETDAVSPLNVYARTKREAEDRVLDTRPGALVVRTNFFGWGTPHRESFSDWVLHGLQQSRQIPMFNDVFFTPILVNDLIDRVVGLLDAGASGIVHVGGADRLSKYDFGRRLAAAFGYADEHIVPIPVGQLTLKAERPRDMSLNSHKAEGLLDSPTPTLDEGLIRLHRLGREGWPLALERVMTTPSVR
jgi:dTDP-4-dehydrorhamnose reductase